MRISRIIAVVAVAAALSLVGCKEKGRKQGAKPAPTHVASAKKPATPAPTPVSARSGKGGSSPAMCCCLASGVASFVEEPTCKNDMGGSCVAASRCPK
jgi:hypothetical protein